MSKRLAALLFAAPLAFAPAASADPIVSGCWGAASASYCSPELRITPIKGDPSPTPICAGTCTYVGVPTVDPVQTRYEVCLDYTTPAGSSRSLCAVDVDRAELEETLGDQVPEVDVEQIEEDVRHVLSAVPIILERLGCEDPKGCVSLVELLDGVGCDDRSANCLPSLAELLAFVRGIDPGISLCRPC